MVETRENDHYQPKPVVVNIIISETLCFRNNSAAIKEKAINVCEVREREKHFFLETSDVII